jgi:tetratricopeptide (TPR) repeat protein
VSDGAWFGVFLCLGAAVVAGLAWAATRVELSPERRLAYTRWAVAVLALLMAAGLAVVLAAKGGEILDEFRGSNQQVSQSATRFTEFSSSNRWTWWQEAWALFEDAPVAGKGAATFEIARRGLRQGSIVTTEPHNLPLQFLGETGVVGFVLLLGFAVAAAVAVRSALRGLDAADRAAAAALAIGVGAYGLHALVDIHWEFVAVSAPAFFSLGALVGLGADRSARRPLVVAAVGIASVGILYSLVAPYASSRLVDSLYDEIGAGKIRQAVSDGRTARWLNPLSVDPLQALGDAEAERANLAAARGDEPAIRAADVDAIRHYRQAVSLQPENSSTWYALGSYEFFIGRYRAALHDLDRAYGLDPHGPAGRHGGLLDQARAKVEGR